MRRQNHEPKEGICSSCGEECSESWIDTSFDHEFGTEHQGFWGSRCCEAEVVNGGVTVVREEIHTARVNHKDRKVKKGDTYRLVVSRHWKAGGPSWVMTKKVILHKVNV